MKASTKLNFLVLLVFYFVFLPRISMEVFSSTAQLYELHGAEKALSLSLNQYVQNSLSELSSLKVVLKNLRDTAALMKTAKHGGEPVLHYVFLDRFIHNFNLLHEILDDRQKMKDLLRYKLFYHLPNLAESEFHGASDALIRLQSVYNINVTKLSEGHIPLEASRGPATVGARLSGVDTYLLGRVAYTEGDMQSAKTWMQETMRIMGTHDTLVELSEVVRHSDVLNHLAYAYYMQGEWNRSLAIYRQIADKEPNNEVFQNNFQQMLNKVNLAKPSPPKEHLTEEVMTDYTNLCQAHRTADYNQQHAPLTCQYFKGHPRLLLKPVAMERLSIRPSIVQFHDVLSGREIDEIVKLATPKLERAGVNNLETGKIEVVNYRVSKLAWLSDQEGDVIKVLNMRAEALTGLSISTAEDLQVNNYGLAGHYEPHYDFALNMNNSPIAELGTGNRMATLMFYLSEVEAGGDTVFLNPSIRVAPKKGSAVFWYNLLPSGKGDWDTLHAGCPVIAGSKWVANKWFHEQGQEFRRPCKLQQYA